MRFQMALVAACGVMALATAANAQDVSVTPGGASITQLGDNVAVNLPVGDGDVTLNLGGQVVGGAHYSSNYSVGSQISFESGSVAVGKQVFKSQSVSNIGLQAYYDGNVTGAKLVSQITAAGMGFYVSSGDCFSSPMGCSQSRNAADNFSAFAVGSGATVRTLATVSFDFAVVQDEQTLEQFTGSINLNVQNGAYFIDTTNAPVGLTGLRTLQFGLPDSDFGYAWNATDLPVALNDWNGYSDISYIATVTSRSNAACLADGACIVAYSGFGDPIGGGGDISSNAAAFSADSFGAGFSAGSDDGLNSTCPNPTSPGPAGKTYINCVVFSPTTFAPPTFNNGVLTFAPGGAPEPASWALMILGFGALGATLRRRRSVVAAA